MEYTFDPDTEKHAVGLTPAEAKLLRTALFHTLLHAATSEEPLEPYAAAVQLAPKLLLDDVIAKEIMIASQRKDRFEEIASWFTHFPEPDNEPQVQDLIYELTLASHPIPDDPSDLPDNS